MNELSFDEHYRKFYPLIQKFRLMDDTFMSQVFQNRECTQFLIRAILNDDGLVVTHVDTQNSLKNLRGRSVRLDITAHDESGKVYNIEVQRSDAGALPKRARYNSAMMDANITEPGEAFDALPETYVIFITETDYYRSGLPLYHVERKVEELNRSFQDDAHIIYVNGQYRGNDRIGSLMHDFSCTDPKDMYSRVLADEVTLYKSTDKGVNHMCRIMEDLTNESREEGRLEGQQEGRKTALLDNVRKFIASGMTFEEIANILQLNDADKKFVAENLNGSTEH